MPLSQFRYASGQKVHAGDSGKVYPPPGSAGGGGAIYVSRPAPHGIDANLWGALKVCVDQLDLSINCNSLTTGKHSEGSRHYAGLAADINKIGPSPGQWKQATLGNASAVRLVRYLLANGWSVGEGDPTRPAILFGPVGHSWNPSRVDHSTHLHVSVARRRPGMRLFAAPPGVGEEPVEEPEPTDDV
jgi:hypothetical protein